MRKRTWSERQSSYGFMVPLQTSHVQQASTSSHVPHCGKSATQQQHKYAVRSLRGSTSMLAQRHPLQSNYGLHQQRGAEETATPGCCTKLVVCSPLTAATKCLMPCLCVLLCRNTFQAGAPATVPSIAPAASSCLSWLNATDSTKRSFLLPLPSACRSA